MKRNSARSRISSIKIACIFLLLVIFVVIIASAIRLIITAQGSLFDGEHQFVLLIQSESSNSLLTVFTPATKSITIFSVVEKNESIAKDLQIGIDGRVTTSLQTSPNNFTEELKQTIFTSKSSPTNVTWYDLARLYFLSTSAHIIVEKKLILPHDHLDTQITAFIDPDVRRENEAIQIINASDTTGLGTRLSTLITNIGGNIIDIRTASLPTNHSEIHYYGTITYTAQHLEHILGFPLKKQLQQSIADVQIIIGTDSAKTTKF